MLSQLSLLPAGTTSQVGRVRRTQCAVRPGLTSLCAPAGAQALLALVPKLMLKLQEEEDEEVQTLLLSTLSSCSRLDALPALASGGISLLGHKLCHPSPGVRREAAAAMMALRSVSAQTHTSASRFLVSSALKTSSRSLASPRSSSSTFHLFVRSFVVFPDVFVGCSVCEDGKQQVCEEAVLPVLLHLLQDEDVEIQANAAGVIMYTVIITAGVCGFTLSSSYLLCVHLDT